MMTQRLVLVEWVDSHSSSGWQVIEGDIEDRALVCLSVGWLLLDGANVKVVAPHKNHPEDSASFQTNGVMTIPTCSVVRMVDLHEAVA